MVVSYIIIWGLYEICDYTPNPCSTSLGWLRSVCTRTAPIARMSNCPKIEIYRDNLSTFYLPLSLALQVLAVVSEYLDGVGSIPAIIELLFLKNFAASACW